VRSRAVEQSADFLFRLSKAFGKLVPAQSDDVPERQRTALITRKFAERIPDATPLLFGFGDFVRRWNFDVGNLLQVFIRLVCSACRDP
jgi:hypothetical protein